MKPALSIRILLALGGLGATPEAAGQIFSTQADQTIWWETEGYRQRRDELFAVTGVGPFEEQRVTVDTASTWVRAAREPGVAHFFGYGTAGPGPNPEFAAFRVRMFIGASDVFSINRPQWVSDETVLVTLRQSVAGSLQSVVTRESSFGGYYLDSVLQAVLEGGAQWANRLTFERELVGMDGAFVYAAEFLDHVQEITFPYRWGTPVNVNLGAFGIVHGEVSHAFGSATGHIDLLDGLRFEGLSLTTLEGEPIEGYVVRSQNGFLYRPVPEPATYGMVAALALLGLGAVRIRRRYVR
jgi:hypothetical protein